MREITDPNRAKRLARTIASDISLFHEQQIMAGLAADDFFERLSQEIDKGRQHYQKRVSQNVWSQSHYFDEAIVDIIIYPRGHLDLSIWHSNA